MSELRLEGVKRIRKVRANPRTWNARRARTFLASLVETCNIRLSAKRAGLSHHHVYDRRNKDASFRASWDEALSTGYAQLEMMMLERALHGVAKVITSRDGTTTTMREYSDRTALALLRMHRDNASYAIQGTDESELADARDRIVERLSRLREQDQLETKSLNVGELIGWALRRS